MTLGEIIKDFNKTGVITDDNLKTAITELTPTVKVLSQLGREYYFSYRELSKLLELFLEFKELRKLK